jgi:uncharacterized cofD-like protein
MVNRRLWKVARWLYPGMRVKRWVLLSLAATGCIVFSLLELVGKERISQFYRLLPDRPSIHLLFIIGLLLIGVFGFAVGIASLVHSLARGLVPGRDRPPVEMIYQTRILDRGPTVVALGGGTGLSTLLRGLKEITSNLTAVVTVMDDGGSSGRLRTELDVLPPGDIRNCILALAEDEERISRFLQHRLHDVAGLEGHSLGNLLLVGIEQAAGGFDRAIEELSHILNTRGHVLPATLAKTHLVAQMKDGEWVEGESQITKDPRQIERISLSTTKVAAYDRVLEAIARADLILLGPGSLFTSLIPNLLVDRIANAIEEAASEKLYIANLMTQPGETDGFSLRDHLQILCGYIDLHCFDGVIVNTTIPAPSLLERYHQELAEPVRDDLTEENEYKLRVIRADLLGIVELEGKATIKHDPYKLARIIRQNAYAFSHKLTSP